MMEKNPYEIPYNHRTTNHLIFDRIRDLQIECDILAAYIEQGGSPGSTAHEVKALRQCSTIIFDEVYKSLRTKWL